MKKVQEFDEQPRKTEIHRKAMAMLSVPMDEYMAEEEREKRLEMEKAQGKLLMTALLSATEAGDTEKLKELENQ